MLLQQMDLWDDGRTDEGQLGFQYKDLEDAMKNPNSPHRQVRKN